MNIPSESTVSLKEGVWLIHNDGINTIQYWASLINGKEKIYLNDKLIHDTRNLKRNKVHYFTDDNKNEYEIMVSMKSMTKGILEFEFKQNGSLIKEYEMSYEKTVFEKGWKYYLMLLINLPTVLVLKLCFNLNFLPTMLLLIVFNMFYVLIFLRKIILKEL